MIEKKWGARTYRSYSKRLTCPFPKTRFHVVRSLRTQGDFSLKKTGDTMCLFLFHGKMPAATAFEIFLDGKRPTRVLIVLTPCALPSHAMFAKMRHP